MFLSDSATWDVQVQDSIVMLKVKYKIQRNKPDHELSLFYTIYIIMWKNSPRDETSKDCIGCDK